MSQERRVAERRSARLPVEFHYGSLVGYGTVMDISLSGARIEKVTHRPLPSRRLKILIDLDQAKEPVELSAEVVRYTGNEGFAVRFPDLDVRGLRVLRVVLSRIEELSQELD